MNKMMADKSKTKKNHPVDDLVKTESAYKLIEYLKINIHGTRTSTME